MRHFINIKYILALFVIVLSVGCSDDFLERKPDNQLDEEQVFTRYDKVNQLVTQTYNDMKMANRPLVFFNHFSSAPVTDECEGSTAEGSLTNKFNSGDWSSMGMPDRSSCGQYWWDLYDKVRKANVILEGVKKYNTPDNPLQPGDLNYRIGETFFMRAYFHYLLLRMYGEVPYVNHKVDPQGSMEFPQLSVHELAEKICIDCDSALNRVPGIWGGADFARIDKGACLGLKAMVRWTVATPLWNGGEYPGTRIHESDYTYKADRWEKVKVAAKALLDFQVDGNKRYTLYTKYTDTDFNDDAGRNLNNSKVYTRLWQLFYDMDAWQKEAVLIATRDKAESWQGDLYPPSRGGSSRQMPIQEQVDEYEYIAPDGYGYPVYASRAVSDGYDDKNPYESTKRDPRFYRDIIYHGAAFRDNSNNQKPMNTADGSDKIGVSNATTTGYYLRKFLKESWNRSGSFSISAPPVWRLPEFIYMYCEAVNETAGPNQEIYDLLNTVRARSFMAPIPPAAMTNKSLMDEYIKRERRVELFYENKRIWECRLYLEPNSDVQTAKETAWKSAGSTNDQRSQTYWPYPKCQRMINGMRPVEDNTNGKIAIGSKKYRMERYWIEDRVFVAPRHYLFPIMDDEMKRTSGLVQNQGW